MQNIFFKFISNIHSQLVFQRRVQAISKAIEGLIKPGLVLDVGSGNGLLGKSIMLARQDIQVFGTDILLRTKSFIPTILYQDRLPFEENTFSSVLLIDVLHHTHDPIKVVDECLRVAKFNVIVKDHFADNLLQFSLLKFMDWVGNRPYGVSLPYNYFSRKVWSDMIEVLRSHEQNRTENVPDLYPSFFFKILGSGIQFTSEIIKPGSLPEVVPIYGEERQI